MHVVVLLLRDTISLPATGAVDLLRKTAEYHVQLSGSRSRRPPVRVELVGEAGKRVRTMAGLEVTAQRRMRDVKRADLVLVPALDGDIPQAIERHGAVVPWLRAMHRRGADLASMCTGAFLIAETGLLSGLSATTHWAAQDLFRARYPDVTLKPEGIIVDEGRIVTGGGASSFMNLVMYLAERHLGQATARFASRMFLIDHRENVQQAYAIFSPQKRHGDRAILRAQTLIESSLAEGLGVADAAREAGLSLRTFVRRFRATTGNTPLEYIQRTRVEAAKRLLETSNAGLGEIVRKVGYEDVPTFRRLFTRHVGINPMSYRRRYQPRS